MQKVKITIKNNKSDDEPIEVVYIGALEEKENSTYVSYKESELTGMEGVNTELFLKGDHLEIVRTGKVESKMIFRENVKNDFLYVMDFGILNMTLETDKLRIVRTHEGYDILIRYNLEIVGNPVEKSEMNITIEKN